jgi:uncharacterized RDD family membrane protein YckC
MVNKTEIHKTSVLKRIFAKIVDWLIAWVLALIVPPAGIVLGMIYLAVADGLQKGQSLGKMVFGLDVVKQDGSPCLLSSVCLYFSSNCGLYAWTTRESGWVTGSPTPM